MKNNKIKPSLREERRLWRRGFRHVCGIDEAGRGPLAGPVVAGAVVVRPPSYKLQTTNYKLSAKGGYNPPRKKSRSAGQTPNKSQIINNSWNLEFKALLNLVRDSKQLTEKQREMAYGKLTKSKLIDFGIGIVSEKTIDKINIKNAAEKAMCLAVKKLSPNPDFVLIDGNSLKNKNLLQFHYRLIVKGDQKVFSIAAASIIAKVTRDRLMERYNRKFPGYGFDIHKGYPSKSHVACLKKLGPSRIHRRSFGPVKEMIKRLD